VTLPEDLWTILTTKKGGREGKGMRSHLKEKEEEKGRDPHDLQVMKEINHVAINDVKLR